MFRPVHGEVRSAPISLTHELPDKAHHYQSLWQSAVMLSAKEGRRCVLIVLKVALSCAMADQVSTCVFECIFGWKTELTVLSLSLFQWDDKMWLIWTTVCCSGSLSPVDFITLFTLLLQRCTDAALLFSVIFYYLTNSSSSIFRLFTWMLNFKILML